MHIGFTPCVADPELWMPPEVRPSDGMSYYAYVLLYMDDVLVALHNATDVLFRLDKYFKMKPGSIGDPDVYLGTTIKQMRLANGVLAGPVVHRNTFGLRLTLSRSTSRI